jgi:ABC-type branched-subunit amino acid transport system substrate-binding protein
MRFGLEAELWMRRAPRSHIAATAVAFGAAVALLAASLFTTHQSTTSLADGSGATVGTGASPSGLTSGTTGPSAGASTPGGATPAGGTGGGAVTGSSAGSSAGTAGATPGGSGGGSGAPGGEPTSGGSSGGSGASTPLTASDQGVTASTIKIGFLFNNLAAEETTFGDKGAGPPVPPYVAALIAHQNKAGGILGRQIQYVSASPNALDESSQNQACTSMALDQKVFAVIDLGGITYSTQRTCLPITYKIPYLSYGPEYARFYTQAAGYMVGALPPWDVLSPAWAQAASSTGTLTKGETVGIIDDNCDNIAQTVLASALLRLGAGKVVNTNSDCTVDQVAQMPTAVTQLKLAGATLVFPAVSFVTVTAFLDAAQAQDYQPKYFASDWWGNAESGSTQNYPAAEWAGTRGVTATYASNGAANAPFNACNAIAVQAGLPPLTLSDLRLLACDLFNVFVAAATKAGPDLTRAGWADAAEHLGSVPVAEFPAGSLSPTKMYLAEQVHDVEWAANCTCYNATDGWRPAYP